MTPLSVFHRLIVRPLRTDPARAAVTLIALSLGVAVVVAIDLAAEAATGSFRSSLEALAGDADLEITAVGGVDERLLGRLVRLPHAYEFSPRVEGFADVLETGRTAPVFGLDLIGDPTLPRGSEAVEFDPRGVEANEAIWVGRDLAEQPGERLRLRINDRVREFIVAGVLRGEGFEAEAARTAIVLDIGLAQEVLSKRGRLDRIQVRLPENDPAARRRLDTALPPGVDIRAVGAAQTENRKMLGAFRWNLRVLSYLSLIVGAFLIYNAISVTVVRRRTEIGVLRALGATRGLVRTAFLAEAAAFGVGGTLLGALLGRALAEGAVDLMALTVQTLYATGQAGDLELTPARWAVAAVAGIGVALLAAWQPASEAAAVPPTAAMAHGQHDYQAQLHVGRGLALGLVLALAAAAASMAPPVAGKPLFGYLAAVLLLGAAAAATPAVVASLSQAGAGAAYRLLGVEGLLGSRSISGSLGRTAVIVAALGTATAMLVSIAILVGSFRQTVVVWMERQLRADLYLRPAGEPAADQFPTFESEIADRIERLPGVEAVDRFRGYPIRYDGQPATLGASDALVHGARSGIRFVDGDRESIIRSLARGEGVIVSEPFSAKRGVRRGDRLRLPLGGREADFLVLGVFYDYSSERGVVIVDRKLLLEYLPDPDLSSLAIYLAPGFDWAEAERRIVEATAGRELYITSNRRLREQAIGIFDRTFAITYALEAVAIAVAVLGMAGALLALTLDRKREISVLRFMGASVGQVRKLILVESGLLGLLSIVVGLAVGSALSLVLVYVINRQSFGWTIQFHWPAAQLLAALALIYLASVAAGLYPARIAAALNPIEAIHEE